MQRSTEGFRIEAMEPGVSWDPQSLNTPQTQGDIYTRLCLSNLQISDR